MKLILGGSRTVLPTDEQINACFDDVLFVLSEVEAIVCGMAKGCDLRCKEWADSNSIPVIEMPVTKEDYQKYGSYLAPKMRNRRVAEIGHAAIMFWDGTSGGTADMVTRMVARGKPVQVRPTKAVVKEKKETGRGRAR